MRVPAVSVILMGTFLVLALFHLVWIFRPIGDAVIPVRNGVPLFKPSGTATFVVAVLLIVCGALVFFLVHPVPSVPDFIVRIGNAVVAGVFALRAIGDFRYAGFFKKHKEGLFASRDSRYYSPLCVMISAGLVFLLFAPR